MFFCVFVVLVSQAAAFLATLKDAADRMSDAAAWRHSLLDAVLEQEAQDREERRQQAERDAANARRLEKQRLTGVSAPPPKAAAGKGAAGAGAKGRAVSKPLPDAAPAGAAKAKVTFAVATAPAGATPTSESLNAILKSLRLRLRVGGRPVDGRPLRATVAPFVDYRTDALFLDGYVEPEVAGTPRVVSTLLWLLDRDVRAAHRDAATARIATLNDRLTVKHGTELKSLRGVLRDTVQLHLDFVVKASQDAERTKRRLQAKPRRSRSRSRGGGGTGDGDGGTDVDDNASEGGRSFAERRSTLRGGASVVGGGGNAVGGASVVGGGAGAPAVPMTPKTAARSKLGSVFGKGSATGPVAAPTGPTVTEEQVEERAFATLLTMAQVGVALECCGWQAVVVVWVVGWSGWVCAGVGGGGGVASGSVRVCMCGASFVACSPLRGRCGVFQSTLNARNLMSARRVGMVTEINRQRLAIVNDNWVLPVFNPLSYVAGGGVFGGEWSGNKKSESLTQLRSVRAAGANQAASTAIDDDVAEFVLPGAGGELDGGGGDSDDDGEEKASDGNVDDRAASVRAVTVSPQREQERGGQSPAQQPADEVKSEDGNERSSRDANVAAAATTVAPPLSDAPSSPKSVTGSGSGSARGGGRSARSPLAGGGAAAVTNSPRSGLAAVGSAASSPKAALSPGK